MVNNGCEIENSENGRWDGGGRRLRWWTARQTWRHSREVAQMVKEKVNDSMLVATGSGSGYACVSELTTMDGSATQWWRSKGGGAD